MFFVFFVLFCNLNNSFCRHYSLLPRELILRVYRRYQLDFEMFDYSIDDILIKAGHELLRVDEHLYNL